VRRAVVAEWGKVWSLRAPWFCVPAAVVLTAGIAFTLANDFGYDIREHRRPATDTMPVVDALGPAIQLGQLALVALAMLVITSEYGTGVVRATFLARPRRGDVLLAKTVVATVIGFGAGLGCAVAGWSAAAADLGRHGVAGSPVAGCLRVALTVALACAFTVAVGSVLRSSAGTLTTAFVMLVGLTVLSPRVGAYTPAGASVAFISADSGQYPSWAGLIVLAGWVGAAQLAAHVLLVRRDA
jgi:ABC-2 type transport system permease protein